MGKNFLLTAFRKYQKAKEISASNEEKLKEEYLSLLLPEIAKNPIIFAQEVRQLHDIFFTIPETFNDFVTTDSKVKNIIKFADYIAKTDFNILLLGETGTGKEIFANSIWKSSKRKDAPFIAVNCAAINGELFEAEMFGIENKVATGVSGRIGNFEAANNGTLFLDEIGELPMENQSKLLRVLQERKVTKIGSRKPMEVNFRLICATSKKLPELLNIEFRSDLYYRINSIIINLPALRNRSPQDIETLLNHFLNLSKKKYSEFKYIKIDKSVIKALNNYKWLGNIRELQSFIHQATITAAFMGTNIDENIMNICLDLHPKEKSNSEDIENRCEPLKINESIEQKYKKLFSVEFFEGFKMDEFCTTIQKGYLKEALSIKDDQTHAGKLLGYSQSTINRLKKKFSL